MYRPESNRQKFSEIKTQKTLRVGFCITLFLSESQNWILPFQQSESKGKRKIWEILGLCQISKEKLQNLKVTMVPTMVGSLGTIRKHLKKKPKKLEIRRRIVSVQRWWDQVEYFEESWRAEESSYHLSFNKWISSNNNKKKLNLF